MSVTMENKEKHPLGPKAGNLTTQQQMQPSNRSQVNVRTEHAPPNAPVLDEVLLTTRMNKTTYADKERPKLGRELHQSIGNDFSNERHFDLHAPAAGTFLVYLHDVVYGLRKERLTQRSHLSQSECSLKGHYVVLEKKLKPPSFLKIFTILMK